MSKGLNSPAAACRYRFGSAEFDAQRLELRVAGLLVDVQRKPLEILVQLLAHAGEIVTHDQLLATVWQGRPVVDNVIASAINKLRGALGHEHSQLLVTHPRRGYRWRGVVQRLEEPKSLPETSLAPGMLVPSRTDFVLASQLESGSHSDVWIAQHLKTGARRVYKLARGSLGLEALRREAALLRLLQDQIGERTDIARVVDWELHDAPYFVAYHFAGVDLAAWANTDDTLSSMPLAQRLELFLDIARAVAAVHAVGVIHQDLKPSNILLTPRGIGGWQVRLTDFGCGRLLQSERLERFRITQFGLLSADVLTSCSSSGTPMYVAPELMAGRAASEQSDIYALGVLLHQFVIGDLRRPIAQGWERHVDDEFLREDIAAATDCDLDRRFARVSELCARLERIDARRLAQQTPPNSLPSQKIDRRWIYAMVALSVMVLTQAALFLTTDSNLPAAKSCLFESTPTPD